MSLTQILSQAWGSARLRVLGHQRFFEIESKKALDAFLEAPVKGKNIQAALKYFTIDYLARALVDYLRESKKNYEELEEALRIKGEDNLSAIYRDEIIRTNQKLYEGVMALYGHQYNPPG